MRVTLPIAIVDRVEQQAIAGWFVVLFDQAAKRGAPRTGGAGVLEMVGTM